MAFNHLAVIRTNAHSCTILAGAHKRTPLGRPIQVNNYTAEVACKRAWAHGIQPNRMGARPAGCPLTRARECVRRNYILYTLEINNPVQHFHCAAVQWNTMGLWVCWWRGQSGCQCFRDCAVQQNAIYTLCSGARFKCWCTINSVCGADTV